MLVLELYQKKKQIIKNSPQAAKFKGLTPVPDQWFDEKFGPGLDIPFEKNLF